MEEIALSTDFKEMELLGQTSPSGQAFLCTSGAKLTIISDPEYLASCPEILPPKLNAIGIVGNISPNVPVRYQTFTVSGTSFIVRTCLPVSCA